MSEQITIDAEADRMPSVTIPAHHCDTDPVASVVHRIDGWEAPKWATHSDFTENSITWDREVIVKADELAPALARFDLRDDRGHTRRRVHHGRRNRDDRR
jgi:hypothetical protein